MDPKISAGVLQTHGQRLEGPQRCKSRANRLALQHWRRGSVVTVRSRSGCMAGVEKFQRSKGQPVSGCCTALLLVLVLAACVNTEEEVGRFHPSLLPKVPTH